MRRLWLAAAIVAIPIATDADWKGDIAKKAIGRAVREGLEDAARDAALGVALDAVVPEVTDYAASRLPTAADYADVASDAADGIEAAMRVAHVADRLDDAADAARALKSPRSWSWSRPVWRPPFLIPRLSRLVQVISQKPRPPGPPWTSGLCCR